MVDAGENFSSGNDCCRWMDFVQKFSNVSGFYEALDTLK